MSDTNKDRKDLSLSVDGNNSGSILNSFLGNEHHVFVVRKAEKLASALYILTNFMSDGEPLRTRLRSCALDIVSLCSAREYRERGNAHEVFATQCSTIGSTIKVAERAGYISAMNSAVMCDEYAELGAFVLEHRDKLFTSGALDVRGKLDTKRGGGNLPKGQSRTGSNKRHSHRRDSIMSLFDKKDKITIHDARNSVVGCSEKTIQRELMALVQEGILVKEGERRWSTYRRAPSGSL